MKAINWEKTIKAILYFGIGLLGLYLYNYLDTNPEVMEYIRKADRFRSDTGFGLLVFFGLVKLITLTVGVSLPVIMTYLLIREQVKGKQTD